MPVKIEDRPIGILREEVIDQLIMNYGHEKLSLEAFERRLDSAMESNDPHVLVDLTQDLDLNVDQDYVDLKKQEMSHKSTMDEPNDYGREKEVDYLVNIFGGSGRSGIWNVAREMNVINIFGGGDIDLTDARFSHKTVHIKVFSLFGGSTIFVPDNINVCVKAFCIFGGIDNRAASVDDASVPTVVIDGISIFSGINIKVKRTIKERFMRFADGIKNVLS